MKIALALTATLLAALTAPRGGTGDAVPSIFELSPREHGDFIAGPIGNAQAAMGQARARVLALDEEQRGKVRDAARLVVGTGPFEAATVDLVRTLHAQLEQHAASVPVDVEARALMLCALPAELVEVVNAQDARLAALTAAVGSHRELLHALAVPDGCCCCCDEGAPWPPDPGCEPPPGCTPAPDCAAAPGCAADASSREAAGCRDASGLGAHRMPATPDEVVATLRTVMERAAALDADQGRALEFHGGSVAFQTATLWDSKAVLIRYRTELEDLLADSARLASRTRAAQDGDDQELIALERRSRLLRDGVIELTGMLGKYLSMGC
jgi:hypothetical protein